MDAGIIAVSIPIVAIGGGIFAGIVKNILNHQERRLELQLQAQQGKNNEVVEQIAALRAEIAGLRDTSTQFDISLEQTVQRLEQRVAHLEIRGAPTAAEVVQRVGQR